MSEFKVCRICLRNQSKFYSLDEYDLKNYYEEVTNLRVTSKDGLPQYFCYECAALLYKFYLFKEKCYDGQKVLQEMLNKGPITYAGICALNTKKPYKCQTGHLEILTVNKRVKTFIQHSTVKEEKSEELKDNVIDVIYSDKDFSDDDNFEYQDPETDPVAQEDSIPIIQLKTEVEVKHDNEAILPIAIETIKDSDESTQPENLVIEEKKEVKSKQQTKQKRAANKRQTRKGKKRNCKRRKKPFTDSEDSNSSDEVLIKVKSRKASAFVPDRERSYKFNKPKSKLRNLAFLDSGFWKKSSLNEEDAIKAFEAKAKDRKYLNAAFKCTDCYKGFSQKNMLDRHIPQRHSDAAGKMVCRFCKMHFKSQYFLNKHMRQHYTKYECLRCDLVCTLETSALFHEEYHNGVIRKCPHCDKEFKHLSTFYTHLRTHRSKHMCALCGESFVSELGLRLHRKAKHFSETEPPSKEVEGSSYCDVCKIKFETRDAYDKHLSHSAMHTDQIKMVDVNLMKNLSGEDEEKSDVETSNEVKAEELHRRRSRVEKTLCAVRKSLSQRKLSKKPTTCHQCGKHFDSQSACMKHHIAEHPRTSFFSPKDRVICEICGASLAPGSVASHLNQHTRKKMYTCDTCGRSFTTSTMLRTHLVTHTGEKRFGCSLCEKRFTQNGSLSLHYRTFHLKQPYPKRNRTKKTDKVTSEAVNGKEEIIFKTSPFSNNVRIK